MKKLSYFLLTLVVAVGGYWGFWYYQASSLQKSLENDLREKTGAHNLTVEYEAIKKSGFPFEIKLQIVNPRALIPNGSSFRFDGEVVNTFTLFGKPKTGAALGKSHLLLVSETGEFFANFQTDIQIIPQESGVRFLLNDLKAGEKQEENEVLYLTVDAADLSLIRTCQSPEEQTIHLHSKVEGYQWIYSSVLGENSSFADIVQFLGNSVSRKKGKTNYTVEFAFDLPSMETMQQIEDSPLTLLTQAIPEFGIALKKFDVSNAFETSHSSAYFNLHEDSEKNLKVKALFESTLQYSQVYGEALRAAVEELRPFAFNPKLNEIVDEIKALVPKFDENRSFKYLMQVAFQLNKENLGWQVSLPKFEISSEQYGIRVKSDAKGGLGDLSGEGAVDLINYKKFVRDVQSAYNLLIQVTNKLKDENEPSLMPITDEMTDKVFAYLEALSTKLTPTSRDISIQIEYKDGQLRVGDLSVEELKARSLALWSELTVGTIDGGNAK